MKVELFLILSQILLLFYITGPVYTQNIEDNDKNQPTEFVDTVYAGRLYSLELGTYNNNLNSSKANIDLKNSCIWAKIDRNGNIYGLPDTNHVGNSSFQVISSDPALTKILYDVKIEIIDMVGGMIEYAPQAIYLEVHKDGYDQVDIDLINVGIKNINWTAEIKNTTWMSLNKNQGILKPGSSFELLTNFRTEKLKAGKYTNTINIHSDAQNKRILEIPVELNIVDGYRGDLEYNNAPGTKAGTYFNEYDQDYPNKVNENGGKLMVFPNPFSENEINILIPESVVNLKSLTILEMDGSIIENYDCKKITFDESREIVLPIQKLEGGIYIIKLCSSKKVYSQIITKLNQNQ